MGIQMKQSKLQMIVQIFALFCAILISGPSNAEKDPETPLLGPINSDPLTVRGLDDGIKRLH